MNDIFSVSINEDNRMPLAYRMSPISLEDFVGQEHIVGEGKLLRKLISVDRLGSLIFFGPPGTGKTSLAKIIANTTESRFIDLNAVEAKVSDVRLVIDEAKKEYSYYRKKTILFVDEIHRFNKSQQDVLLKDLESGVVQFIGATTANPLYTLNSALVSRSKLFEFKPLEYIDIKRALNRAMSDDKVLKQLKIEINNDVLRKFVYSFDGDLRQVLNNFELLVLSKQSEDGHVVVNEEDVSQVIMHKMLSYDDNEHYDLISAFIKSMRASKEDDALYYLSRMLLSGEDPRFIARRMIIFASEDIGLADDKALQLAISVYKATEIIGMPEVEINLTHVCCYLSRAMKSRESYEKGKQIKQRVIDKPNDRIPDHLRNWKL